MDKLLRIISGETIIEYQGETYIHKTPTRRARNFAEHIYNKSLIKAVEQEMFSEEEILELLYQYNYWSLKDDESLETFKKDIENTKVKIFERREESGTVKEGKRILSVAKENINKLLARRHQYDYLTGSAYAQSCKARYLFAHSLFTTDEIPLNETALPLEDLLAVYNTNRLSDEEIRNLSRSDEWQTYWNSRKACIGLFDIAAVDLNDEQRSIINWSQFYDSIQEHPDFPGEIIEDNDMVDGWVILQRRKRHKEQTKDSIENRISDRARGADEVYVFPQYVTENMELVNEDPMKLINKVNEISSDYEKMLKKKRADKLARHGELTELNMADMTTRAMMKNGK
jgi:hypothetical protein